MKVYYALLLIVTPLVGISQPNSTQFKEKLESYPQNVHDSIYYELFKEYRQLDIQGAKYYASLALRASAKFGHHLFTVKASNAIGSLYARLNKIDSAFYYYKKAVKVSTANNFKDRLMFTYNGIGRLYERMDFYDSALYYFTMSNDLALNLESFQDVAICQNNIGLIYYNITDYNQALVHFKEAIRIKRKYNIQDGLNINLLNIANAYNDLEQYDSAIKELKNVEANCNQGCDQILKGDLQYAFGFSYFKKGREPEATPYFIRALEITRRGDNPQTLALTLYHLSLLEINKHTYQQAIDYLQEAEMVSLQIKQKRVRRDIYQQLAAIYKAIDSPDKVMLYQNRYLQVKDSIFNETIALNIRGIDLSRLKKQSEIVIKQKDAQVQESRIKAFVIGAVCILAFAVVLLAYKRVKTNNAQKRILEDYIINGTVEREEMSQALRRKQIEFNYLVYKTSRDIRNPLATVQGLLNLLSSGDSDELKDHINQIQKELGVKVDQLTDLYEIRDQELSIEEFGITAFAAELYENFKGLSEFPVVSLSTDKSVIDNIKTDKKLLIDLVISSIQCFKPFDNKKGIEVFFEQEGQTTVISIADHSRQTYPTLQDNIFNLFISQTTAWKLQGQIILAERDSCTIYKIIVPTIYPELSREKLLSMDSNVIKI